MKYLHEMTDKHQDAQIYTPFRLRQLENTVKIADALGLTHSHAAHSACILMCIRQRTYRNLPLDTHSHAIYDLMEADASIKEQIHPQTRTRFPL